MFDDMFTIFDPSVIDCVTSLEQCKNEVEMYKDSRLVKEVTDLSYEHDFAIEIDTALKSYFMGEELSESNRKILEYAHIICNCPLMYSDENSEVYTYAD
jgi:hypothetical protein